MIWQQPWVWVVAGLVLAGLEMVMPGQILLGFGIGALVVAGLLWAGVLGHSLPVALVVLALASVLAWAVLRRVMGVTRGQTRIWTRDINDDHPPS